MKKWIKRLLLFLAILIGLPVLYFLLGTGLGSIPNRLSKTEGDKTIYLVSNGVHTDIVFSVKDFKELEDAGVFVSFSDQFVAVGWGDRGFYLDTPTWGDLTFKIAINAGFLESETLIHITRYKAKRTKWKPVNINSEQLSTLKAYVLAHLKRPNERVVQIENAHYGKFDEFYEAVGSYSIFKTCNTWVNLGLKKADVKTATWTPFDSGILKWYE